MTNNGLSAIEYAMEFPTYGEFRPTQFDARGLVLLRRTA